MGVSDDIADRFVGRRIDLLRFAEGVREEIAITLIDLANELQAQIRDADAGSVTMSALKRRRMEKIISAATDSIETAYGSMESKLTENLIELVDLEQQTLAGSLNAAVGVDLINTPFTEQTVRELATNSIIVGAPQAEWWEMQSRATQQAFKAEIRQGVLASETNDQLIMRIAGRSTGRMRTIAGRREAIRAGGVLDTSRRKAEALVRTSTQTVSNNVMDAVYTSNADVVRGRQALVTLDGRTTHICIARSGAAWDLGGNPLPESPRDEPWPGPPPWHWNAICEGEPIDTIDGQTAIENVKVDQLVITHVGRLRPVYATMSKRCHCTVVIITTESRRIRVTGEHPVLCHPTGWVRADQLKEGDKLFRRAVCDETLGGGAEAKIGGVAGFVLDNIKHVSVSTGNRRVYNLSVSKDETFLVNGIVVHNCRTILIPVLKDWDNMQPGSRPAGASPRTQSSLDGEVAGDLKYSDWIKGKDDSFARDVLGASKFELWKAGKLKLSQLIDQTGRPLTVAELRERFG